MTQRSFIHRRTMLLALSGYGLVGAGAATSACARQSKTEREQRPLGESVARAKPGTTPKRPLVLARFPLRDQWQTFDPFLFCVHHDDAYPAANEAMGPAASLAGRNLGSDFAGKDGWRMYHGEVIPGFPRHPHRGFETITITRRGYIDHSDSLGATARYGEGDVQWMTAGRGIAHAEMFPLLDREGPNPAELFQIWLNLPKQDKFVEPHFAMLWHEKIPELEHLDAAGRRTRVRVIAGGLQGKTPPEPPPNSWAKRAEADFAVWSLRLAPGATFSLPAVGKVTDRTLYFFQGRAARVAGEEVGARTGLRLAPGEPIEIVAGDGECEFLLLQAKPIGEAVAKRGPFVMNAPEELAQAYADYRRTQFGGWPWPASDPVHPRDKGRFAIHADGREERAI